MPHKVLIITYYWPPAGGIAVQRWLKFSKYLGDYGWQPIIYTVSNGNYQLIDNSMLKDVPDNLTVIKRPIWEPHRLYASLLKKKTSNLNPDEIKPGEGNSLLRKFSVWVRSNFFIPDARMFWISPSVKFLTKYLRENKVDALVSTGPPHSTHLIALELKRKLNIPWLADFRDPWTSMDYHQELFLTKWADRKHHKLEHEVLTQADALMVIGQGMRQEFEQKRKSEVVVVTNGFDEEDFSNEMTEPITDFSIVHMGSFFARVNPIGLWQALGELVNENHPLVSKLKIKLTGRVAPVVIDSINEHGLGKFLTVETFKPHHQAIRQMKNAAVLLLSVYEENKFIVTGKLFEYLAARRPILFIGPKDGDAAKIVVETETGPVFSRNESDAIKRHILFLYDQFEKGELQIKSDRSLKYAHRILAKDVAGQLNLIAKL